MTADLAVVDPDLTMNCPRGVTVASGLDALVQAVEAFVSPKGTAYTRALAKAAACKRLDTTTPIRLAISFSSLIRVKVPIRSVRMRGRATRRA